MLVCQSVDMKKLLPSIRSWKWVVKFGSAELVQNQNGKIELRGGTRADHVAAREWISLFAHEAVPHIGEN
jgi:hypothetical protein